MLGWFSAEATCSSRSKPARALRIFSNLVRQELQGNEAVQLHILSLVNHTHPAA